MTRDRTLDFNAWARHLRALAQPVIESLDVEAQWLHAVARPASPLLPMLVRRLGRSTPRPHDDALPIDTRLWWSLVERDDADDATPRDVALEPSGPLTRQDAFTTVEVWTETELGALHALSRLALEHVAGRGMAVRVRDAVDWHVEHTQPDNATNHAWATHAFLMRGTAEARAFAETLLSNCMVMNGRPDPMSAWILLDSADALEHAAAGPNE